MAHKRQALEGLENANGQLSAFAAAKLARQSKRQHREPQTPPTDDRQYEDTNNLATALANVPYDGQASQVTTPGVIFAGENETTQSRRPVISRLSQFQPESSIVRDDEDFLELRLRSDDTITVLGEYVVEVLGGVATLYGAVLRPNSLSQKVYAPTTHALPELRARQDMTDVRLTSSKSGLRDLATLSPLFRNLWASEASKGRTFTILDTTDDDPLQRSIGLLEIDKECDAVLRTISARASVEQQKPRIMAVGAKSSGKSTFNRILCNHLLSWTSAKKIQYLDLDPGQPEFGPSGQVSLIEVSDFLLGPPFAHSASSKSSSYRLVHSHTIAATSFKDDPEHFVACVSDVIRRADKKLPVVVNFCGWVSGLGASILAERLVPLGITDVVLLDALDESLIDSIRSASNSINLHRIPRRPPKPASRSPAEYRAMQNMAFFHSKLSATDSNPAWSKKPINRMRPWIVSYAGPNPGVSAIISYGQSPDPEFLAEVMDGSIVAIVIASDSLDSEGPFFLPTSSSTANETQPAFSDLLAYTSEAIPYIKPTPQGTNYTINPARSYCAGLALIRGIDQESQALHLLTPLPANEITTCRDKTVFLVRSSGFDSPPEWAYLEDLFAARTSDIPGGAGTTDQVNGVEQRPWVTRRRDEGAGIEGAVWRLRHPPLASASASASTARVPG